ncbi:hypothetical protein QFZ51_001671 [Chitinophaga sp. W3I9]
MKRIILTGVAFGAMLSFLSAQTKKPGANPADGPR